MALKPFYFGLIASLVVFILLLASADNVGVVWDEPIYSEASERAARWLGLLLRGEVAAMFDPYTFGIAWGLVSEHPPLLRVVNGLGWALVQDWLPAPLSHRFGSLVLASLATGAVVGVTFARRGARVALFAGAALLAMPRLFLHMHLGVLDFPLAAIWIIGTLIFYGEMDRIRRRDAHTIWQLFRSTAVVGFWIGLGLLTKINAVLLLPYWGLWLLGYRREFRSLLSFALALPVGLLVLIGGWPWIWKDPVGGLWQWIEFFRVHFEIRQWFAGQLYVVTPPYLPIAILLITTPVLLLLLAIVGICFGQRPASAERRLILSDDWTGLHVLGILTVLGYYSLQVTPIHDQDRLLLPVFVHLAILSGDGFDRLCRWLSARLAFLTRKGRSAGVQAALAGLILLPGVVQSVRLHPYQLSYYNEIVGGVAGARRLNLETIYFAITYGHFLPALNSLPPNAVIWVMPNSWDVLYYYQLYGLLRTDLVLLRPPGWSSFYDDQRVPFAVGNLDNADFALIERRQTTFNNVIPEYAVQLSWAEEKPELARLERNGVILAALYGR